MRIQYHFLNFSAPLLLLPIFYLLDKRALIHLSMPARFLRSLKLSKDICDVIAMM